jgi:hypothetical protein
MDSKNIHNNSNNNNNKQPQMGEWTGMSEMGSKTINNNKNNQPQLGCVKWVAKTSTNNLNWDVWNG